MHRTDGHTVIMLAVWRKPPDLFTDIPMTEIAFGADHLPILQRLLLIRKFPRNILHIIMEEDMDLFLSGCRKHKGINGIVLQHLFRQNLKYLCRIVSITKGPVKRNILLYLQEINRVFQTSSGLAVLIGNTEQLLYIQKFKRTCA